MRLDASKHPAPGTPGSNDERYGEDGGKTLLGVARALETVAVNALQGPAGKTYVTGHAEQVRGISNYWIVCLDANGLIQREFGTEGFVVGSFAERDNRSKGHRLTLVQGDSPQATRLLLTGDIDNQLALARFTLDGQLDPTFADHGTAIIPIQLAFPDEPVPFLTAGLYARGPLTTHSLENGKILVSGTYLDGTRAVGLVMRLTADGELDKSLNGRGYFSVEHPGYASSYTLLNDLIIAADGTYVGCGIVWDGRDSPCSVFFTNLHPDGTVNTRYGINGFSTIADTRPVSLSIHLDALVQRGNQTIGFGSSSKFALGSAHEGLMIAVDSAGLPAPGFNGGRPHFSESDGAAVAWATGALQADAKVLAAGACVDPEQNNPTIQDFAFRRLLPDGAPDPDFNSGETVRHPFSSAHDAIRAISLQAHGQWLLIGRSHNLGIVARFYA